MNDNALGEETPIIIKRKKVVKGDDHHGGAWKVAYADFVTAMMAFFLLMWLLNATTEDQRKGLADYFNPSIPISRISGGGSDGLNGSSIFTEETLAEMGTGASRQKSAGKDIKNLSEEAIEGRLQALKDAMSKADKALSEHVDIKLSPEGIVLELVDSADESLFAVGNSTPNDLLVTLLATVAGSFDGFGNDLKIVGHTDNRQFSGIGGYDNWNLSSDRAHAARQILSEQNFDMSRIREVSGRADTEPLIVEDPSAPQNRRVSIVILTR
ncbi:MAG: flagellar motor protein MotB [Pseudomonadota bacterium]